MCFASLLACFWAPCGAHLASVLGSLACPGLSWTCLGDTNVVADLDKLRFFFTMDFRGPPLTRNGAPGHPKAHQNDFKMVARGLDLWPCLCRLCGSLVFVALGSLIFFSVFVFNCFSYVCLFCLSHCMSIAFLNQVESRAARSAA